MLDYDALLSRAKDELGDVTGTGERFQLPDLDIEREGKATVVRNFSEFLSAVNRESQHVVPILLRELGTAGTSDGDRLTLQGRVTPTQIQERIQRYVDTYVICSECGRPDTHLGKVERTTVLQCDACGAHRPVRVRKAKQQDDANEKPIVQGKTYELRIDDMGRRGDGIARVEQFTVYVKGAQKGDIVHVKVNNVSGTLAFGEVVPEPEE